MYPIQKKKKKKKEKGEKKKNQGKELICFQKLALGFIRALIW